MIRFYSCSICGNLVEMIEDAGIIPNCCGLDMGEVMPGTSDGVKEKHVPVCSEEPKACGETQTDMKHETMQDSMEKSRQDAENTCTRMITVKVGDIPHPMEDHHYIQWIIVETDHGIYQKNLKSCKEAKADFWIAKDEKIKAIYSYCNLHGLWMYSVK